MGEGELPGLFACCLLPYECQISMDSRMDEQQISVVNVLMVNYIYFGIKWTDTMYQFKSEKRS